MFYLTLDYDARKHKIKIYMDNNCESQYKGVMSDGLLSRLHLPSLECSDPAPLCVHEPQNKSMRIMDKFVLLS